MTDIVTFSGWGQDYDVLDNIAPGANHINYRDFGDAESAIASLKGKKCDVLIGWSLGGQLALRAIDAGVLKPKLLVLLATPYQFLAGKGLRCGMDIDTFNAFEIEFEKNPLQTLAQFSLLIAKNDENAKEIIKRLKENKTEHAEKWLPWLDELRNFSCSKLNFTDIPKTLSIHGRSDTVVDASQAGVFHPLIKNYKSVIIEKCGHAPHLHDAKHVMELIKESL